MRATKVATFVSEGEHMGALYVKVISVLHESTP